MTAEDNKRLQKDPDGLLNYEYLANNIADIADDLPQIVENIRRVDRSGQFTASAARYLHAIDPQGFAETIRELVAATIDKDRERRYLPDILQGLYGPDCEARAAELSATDDNFRRIYKRLFPANEAF